MADKCIGKLYLDIGQVKKDIEDVNKFLSQIGANINLEDKLSQKISAALGKLVKEAKRAGEEAQKAISQGLSADINVSVYEKMQQKVLAAENKMRAEADKTIAKQEERAEREAAAVERAEERKRAAREKQEAAYEQVWLKAEAERARAQAAEDARIDREVAKAEAAAEKKAAAEEKAAERTAAAREKQEAAYQKVWDKAIFDQRQNELKQYQKDIEDYAKALATMMNEQAKFNQQVASGKLVEGTEQYTQAEEKLRHLESAAISAGQKLDQSGREAAMGMQEVQTAIDNVNVSMGALNDSNQVTPLQQIENAYKQLTTAIRDYNIAKKANNEEGMVFAQGQIDSAMQTVDLIKQGVNELNVDASTRERILALIEQCKIQQDAQQKGVIGTTQATSELESQVSGLVTRYLSLMAIIRTISNIMNNMIDYVSEYSDKMNEIQMITMKTDAEIQSLADTYRDIASEMNVSSLDMADAAIYFTRQGLTAEEIEKRLRNVTMYAKAANVEFKDASEIITAVVNSMNLVEEEAEDGRNAAQRVADVFLQIGDHAATSGQEIGEAMQKAAASAGAFGVSMEWLASYIATVSETTRQEARTIGTAFNTIIARLHQIKATGYNQEDETKVNDIAKALSKVDVVLLDQEGNWRDMEDILVDVASKWGDLDGKTKSYIATTMAGVKQQNVFLALMNDMSKGAEDGSRAFELYNMAMDSTGVAADKYSVYLDSVTAAQERLTIAQENFYSLLDQNIIKDFYDSMAGLVTYFTKATDAANGLNIIIPLLVGGIAALSVAITALESHPIVLAIAGTIAGIGALTVACGLLVDSIDTVEKRFTRASNVLSASQSRISEYISEQQNLRDMMKDIGTETPITTEKLDEYNDLLEKLGTISPTAKQAIDDLKSGLIDQSDAAKILNEELERAIENEQKISALSFVSKMATWQPGGTGEEQNGLQKSMTNWHSEWADGADGLEGFGNQLQHAYEHRKKHMSSILLDTKTFDYINSILPEGNEVDWGYIGQLVWREFVGTGDPSTMLTSLKNEVDKMIDEAVDVVGYELNEVDKGAFREMLIREIFGEDNELSVDEYKESGKKISELVYNLLQNGMNSVNIESDDSLKYIGERIFGNYFSLLFGDQFDSLKNDPEFDIISGYISEAISELLDAGFSDADIASVLENIDLRNWGSAVSAMKQKLRDEIKNNARVEGLGLSIVDLVTGEETYDPGMWLDLDTATLKYINDLILAGVKFDDIQLAMDASGGSVEEFKHKLEELSDVNFGENIEEQAFSIKDSIKSINASIKDIRALDTAIKDIQDNKDDFNVSDILGLVEAHPEILTVINDSQKLLETLKKIREESSNEQRETFRKAIMNAAPVGEYASSGLETMQDVRDSLTDQAAIEVFDAAVDQMIDSWQKANINAKQVAKDAKAEAKEEADALKEAQKAFKDNISEVETLDKVIAKLQSNKTVDFSDIINLSTAHPEIVAFANDADKLLAVLQRLKNEAKGTTKESIKNILYDSEEYFKGTQYYDPESNIKTMREYITYLHESRGDWSSVAREVDDAAQNIVDAAERTEGAAESWLEAQAKIAEINEEVNWAKSNNFEDQINQLQGAVESGGIQEAITVFNGWSTEMKDAIYKEYPEFIRILGNADKAIDEQGNATRDLTDDTKDLNAALSKAESLNSVKHFTDSAKAIKQLSEGTISATDAYDIYTKDLNKVTKAYEDILDVQNKMAYNAKEVNKNNKQAIDAGDVNNLASLLDMTTEEILADFPAAVDMFNELTGSAGELTDVLNMLNDAAFIRITGTSDADFSAIEAGLISVENLADEAVQKLLATGQWETDVLQLPQTAAIWHPGSQDKGGGYWSYETVTAGATILKPTGRNPFKGSSTVSQKADTKQKTGRSGGGGGSSEHNTKNTETEVERMLDMMSQVNAINQAQQNYYQSQQKYYSQTGQIQGVIAYMQKEKEELESQKPVLEDNIKAIERYMEQKRNELSALSTSDEAYAEVADDLDKLQKAHQNYTKQLIDNGTAIEALTEQMDEQRKKIRQMEIDLRNLILKAIEDRERKREDMMNAEIEMENTIFDLIKRRYEKERDHILEVTNLKIQSLQEERDLLSEQLQLRKEQEEQEDKVLKLRELEVKYQRIVADPTRAKEAKSIRKEIDDLRKEMAWDAAEQEVKAQQDSIDQQITSLEDYSQYIQEYYEDLFEHPQKLIAETREIIMMTQEEILEWLKNNDEAYQNSSELTQQKIVKGWENTYNEMKGILKLYWDEVEEIISKGDDYIIEFLKENSADYAAAGKLQAEAYVDEWKKQLSDLKKAHEQVVANIAAEYEAIAKSTYVAPSGGGGGRSSGGATEDHGYSFTYGGKEYKAGGFTSKEAADSAMRDAVYNILRVGAGTMASSSMIGQGIRAIQNAATVYAKGGIADFTGPAWLDGSPQDPERVLSPYQTKLFEAMVEALERASKITIPSMPNYGDIVSNGGNQISVGDIVVNVDNLDTDDDYEELAKKVSAILMERIGRTTVVGGMRINTI